MVEFSGGTSPTYWHKGKLPWVTITDMTSGVIEDTARKINDLGVKHSSVKLLPANTVILSFKLSVGKVAITKIPL